MNELAVTFESIISTFVVGAFLGLFFFGGLWWTVQKAVWSTRAGPYFVVSLLLRTSVVLAGFYYFGSGNWQRMLACLVGFIIARIVILRLIPQPKELHEH